MIKAPQVNLGTEASPQLFNVYDGNYELEYQIQIGSYLFPEYPCRSLAEALAKLKQCVYGAENTFHSISLKDYHYRDDKFIIGVDLERMIHAGFTALTTKAGDLLTVRVKAMNESALRDKMPTLMHIVLHSDNILQIGPGGITVLD